MRTLRLRGLGVALGLRLAPALLGCAEGPAEHPAPAGPASSVTTVTASVAAAPVTPPAGPLVVLDGRGFPEGVLSLTWDDGPGPSTLELARFLKAEGVAATFFVVHAWVDGLSEEPGEGPRRFETGVAALPILEQLTALGHRVANHTLHHVLLGPASPEVVVAELAGAERLLGSRSAGLYRAPGGAWSEVAARAVAGSPELAHVRGPVRWDIDGKDWEGSLYCRSSRPAVDCERRPGGGLRTKSSVVVARTLEQVDAARRGIVLLHDRVGDVASSYALEVARGLVPALRRRGYVFAAPVLTFGPARRLAQRPRRPAVSAPAGTPPGERFGDLNGDGRPDRCALVAGALRCALATPRGFAEATPWLDVARAWPEAGRAEGGAGAFELLDVTGDGRADACLSVAEAVACYPAP